MRRKPMHGGSRQNNSGGGGNNQRRHGGGYNSGGGRPRKNYSQLREKYLNQAKDALSVGDRVMAEYYFQHADHCYRMMLEEGYRPYSHQQNQNGESDRQESSEAPAVETSAEDNMPNAAALPSFLTMGYTDATATGNAEKAANSPPANWEE